MSIFSVHRVVVKLNASGNSVGHSVSLCLFLIFKNLVPRKRQALEWKIHLDLYVIQLYVVIIVFHFVKQSTKNLGFLFFLK